MATSGLNEALFLALWSVWDSDANKLGNGVAVSKVRDFMRDDDRRLNYAERQFGLLAPPAIVVHIQEDQEDGLGTGTGSKLGGEVLFDLEIFTRKADGSASTAGTAPVATDEDNIRAAMLSKYHEQSIQSAAVTALGWNIQRPVRLGTGTRIPDTTLSRFTERFIVQMSQIV